MTPKRVSTDCYTCDRKKVAVNEHGMCSICEEECRRTAAMIRCAERGGVCTSPITCTSQKRCVQIKAAIEIARRTT